MGKIVWLASYPKSGNTWLRAFLHNLLRDPREAYDINRLVDFSSADSTASRYQRLDPRPVTEMTAAEIARLRPRVHEMLMGSSADNVFVKTHSALVQTHGVPAITMECTAGAIYVVRNPLDIVISFAHHSGHSVDETIEELNRPGMQTATTSGHVSTMIGSWSENVVSWTARPNPALHVTRYEDMLEDPQRAFGAVVQFLGLRPPRDRLLKAIEQSSFESLRDQENERGFRERSDRAERFFRAGRAGQWREALTAAQIDAVIAAHKKQMARFGYFPLPERDE